jgi:outer membrane receptor protein involved in Fe transport
LGQRASNSKISTGFFRDRKHRRLFHKTASKGNYMKTRSSLKLLSLHGAIAAASMSAGQAGAQAVAVTDHDVLEEVMVTAQKRKESINDVPMSIAAITGEQLADKGIDGLADLQKVVSGFHYTEGYAGVPVYYIRGVGFNEASLGALPNIAVYVDEVPVTFPVMTSGVGLDLERVEVLKGPQGTLFGQSSTGGAVNYIAAKPTSTFESAVTLGYANFDDKTVEGYVSGPLAAGLNARFAAKAEKSGPWQRSATTGAELGGKDKLNGRVLLDWQPLEQLKLALNVTGFRDKSEIQALQYVGYSFLSPTRAPRIPQPYQTLIQINPNPNADNRTADWGPRTPEQDNRLTQASLRTEYELPADLHLVYIVSHADFKYDRFSDPDGLSFNNFDYRVIGDIASTSHELRLSGTAFSEAFKWMVGANYDNSTVDELDKRRIDFSSSAYALPVYFNTNDTQVTQEFTNKAAFAALDYDFTPTLIGHAAARHTKASDDFSGCNKAAGDGVLAGAYNSFLGGPVIPVGGCITATPAFVFGLVNKSLEESNTSWRVGLDWKPQDHSLVYANVSKGYKAGSFPSLAASESTQFAPVTQESLLAYEVGFKLNFRERLQLNGAAFHYDYENKQVRGRVQTTLFGFLEALVNVPKSEVNGVEMQATWKPAPGWTTTINGTYLDTKIKDNFTNFTDFGTLGNFDGEAFPNTPELQVNADLEYEWSLSNGYTASVGGDAGYQDSTYNGFGEDARLEIDAYTLFGLRAGVDSPSGKWHAGVWSRNVGDKDYSVTVTRVSDTYVRAVGMPRTFGANFTYRFE